MTKNRHILLSHIPLPFIEVPKIEPQMPSKSNRLSKNGLYDVGIHPLFLTFKNKDYFRRILRSIILGQGLSNEFFTKYTHEVSRLNMTELDTKKNAPMR